MAAFGFTSRDIEQSVGSGTFSIPSSGGSGDTGGGFFSKLGNAARSVGGFLANNFSVGDAVGLGLTAGSFIYQNRQRKKFKKKLRELQDRNAGTTIRTTPAGGNVPIAFGYTAVDAIPIYSEVNDDLPSVPSSFGTLPANPSDGKFDNYLLTQYVLCAAGIESCLDLYVNQKPWETEELKVNMAHEFLQEQASAHATAFVLSATMGDHSNAIGTGLAHLTSFFKTDRDKPTFYSIPQILAFLKGQKVRTVSSSSISSSKSFQNNAVLCFLEYLTNNRWGLGFDDSIIDIDSWSTAAARSGLVTQGNPSSLWNTPYPSDLNTQNGTTFTNWSDYFISLGFVDINDSGLDVWHTESINGLSRHEANGVLLTPEDLLESISEFLDVMPGADFFRGLDGKWKLVIPDSIRTASVQAGSNEINENNLAGPVTITHPNIATRLNQATVIFNNALRDFAQDTVTWPTSGSTAHTTLLDEDNGLERGENFDIELVGNSYHARDIAHSIVMQSRRPTFNFTAFPEAFKYEPGDIVRLNVPIQGMDNYVKISKIRQPLSSFLVSVEAIEFVPSDYAWTTDDRISNSLVQRADYSAPAITTAVATVVQGPKVRQLAVAWDVGDSKDQVDDYLVEYAEMENEMSTPVWRSMGTVKDSEEKIITTGISDLARCYVGRVISRTVNGVRGTPTETNTVMVGNSRIDNLISIDKPNTLLGGAWQLVSSLLPGNFESAFDFIDLGLGETGNRLATLAIKFGVGELRDAIFTPDSNTEPDFTMTGGIKGFLYKTGGQLFARTLGGSAIIKSVTGVVSPPLDGMTFPDIPDLPIMLPNVASSVFTVGDEVSYALPPASGGVDPILYLVLDLPSWASFDDTTRTVSGTAANPGTTEFTYTAIDANAATDSKMASIRVLEPVPVEPEESACIPPQSYEIQSGQDFSFELTEPDFGTGPYVTRLSGAGEHAWRNYDESNRMFTGNVGGTYPSGGSAMMQYFCTDANGETCCGEIMITVPPPPPPAPPPTVSLPSIDSEKCKAGGSSYMKQLPELSIT